MIRCVIKPMQSHPLCQITLCSFHIIASAPPDHFQECPCTFTQKTLFRIMYVVYVLLFRILYPRQFCFNEGSPRAHLHVVGMLRFMTQTSPSLPTPFCSVLVSASVFLALSAVFHSINSPGNSLLSHSVFLPYRSLQLYRLSPYESLPHP